MSYPENQNEDKDLIKSPFLHISTEDEVSSIENLEKLFDMANPDYVINLLERGEGHSAKA